MLRADPEDSKHLGCDIFLLNGWNTPHAFRTPEHRWPGSVEVVASHEGPRTTVLWKTPKGVLTGISEGSHPVKYPVDSLAALRIYREMWEGAIFEAHDDSRTLGGQPLIINIVRLARL